WSESIRLEMIDHQHKTEYEFAYDNSLSDLYDIVRERTSNILEIIDDILGINLEILKAEYGTKEIAFDVTDLARSKVKNNSLKLLASNSLAGDPQPNSLKYLKIQY